MKHPSKKRMIEFIGGREYLRNGETYPISWNIKYHFPASEDGMNHADGSPIIVGESQNNKAFNDRWEKLLKSNSDLFWDVAEDILSPFLSDYQYFYEGTDDPDLSSLHIEFDTTGRSGGWLVVSEYEDTLFWTRTIADLELDSWAWEELHVLYKAVREVDEFVKTLPAAVENGFAYQRSMMEDEWAGEIREQVADVLLRVSQESEDFVAIEQVIAKIKQRAEEAWPDTKACWGESITHYLLEQYSRQIDDLMPGWISTIVENETAQLETFGAFASTIKGES